MAATQKNSGSKLTLLMTFIVLFCFVIVLGMNYYNLLEKVEDKYLSPNDVRGSAVTHQNKQYTLNFEQQVSLLEIINHSQTVNQSEISSKMSSTDKNLEISKIIIYRFNKEPIEITLAGAVPGSADQSKTEGGIADHILLSAPSLNGTGYLKEPVGGQLKTLLLTSYEK